MTSGSQDCVKKEDYHEILCPKDDLYKVKSNLEKSLSDISYSAKSGDPKTIKIYPHLKIKKSKN